VAEGVVGLDHVQVAAPAGCEQVARRFYGELLGLDEVAKPASLAAAGGVWFACGAQGLHVGVAEDFAPAAKAHPGLRVADTAALDELAERLRAAGAPGRARRPPPGPPPLLYATPGATASSSSRGSDLGAGSALSSARGKIRRRVDVSEEPLVELELARTELAERVAKRELARGDAPLESRQG
jgi:catechol 2,3-dioxygenase-like lactoylglutathione lyase family enzyme